MKWRFVARAPATAKYVICNADESEPGTFKDRLILEGDPHSIVEAMALAGYAIGARRGLHLHSRRIRPGARTADTRNRARRGRWASWAQTSSAATSISTSTFTPGRGRLHLRRGDRADRVHRGQARRAALPPAVPDDAWPVGQAHGGQQRGDPGQRAAHYSQRCAWYRKYRHPEQPRHQGLHHSGQRQRHRA